MPNRGPAFPPRPCKSNTGKRKRYTLKQQIQINLNGRARSVEIAPTARLLDVVRDQLGATGTKEGCGEGECGACTVIVDGRAVNSCLFPAIEADGAQVLTIEGLTSPGDDLSPIQQAFLDHGGAQCGFCTPGMIMAGFALISANRDPSDEQIHEALTGNLCRCTGYQPIINAIRAAAAKAREGVPA